MATRIRTLWGQRPIPGGFRIEIEPQYCQGPRRDVLVHPDSVFEGSVRFVLSEPISLRALRLVFCATERINYEAIGWRRNEKKDTRIFSLRAKLLATADAAAASTDLSAGTHVYPFRVEMPMVNYPPSFQHPLVAIQFCLVAHMHYCRDILDWESCSSDPYPIHFMPLLETTSTPKRKSTSSTANDELHIQNENGHIILPSTRFDIYTTHFIPVQLAITTAPQHIRLQLKRHLTITHGPNRRTEVDVLSTCFLDNHSSSSSFSRLALPSNCTPSAMFSKHFQISYQLTVSAKAKPGFMQIWKKLFDVPIVLGTLPEGTWAPEELVKYTDECIARDTTNRWQPRIQRAPQHEEGLPAYDCIRPPDYNTH